MRQRHAHRAAWVECRVNVVGCHGVRDRGAAVDADGDDVAHGRVGWQGHDHGYAVGRFGGIDAAACRFGHRHAGRCGALRVRCVLGSVVVQKAVKNCDTDSTTYNSTHHISQFGSSLRSGRIGCTQSGVHRRHWGRRQQSDTFAQLLQLTPISQRPLVSHQHHILLIIKMCEFHQLVGPVQCFNHQILTHSDQFDFFLCHSLRTGHRHTIHHQGDFLA